MKTDDELYRDFEDGDLTGFEELVIRYRHFLIHIITLKIQDPQTSEDLSQEIFIDILTNKKRFNYKCTFKTYLGMLAKYKILDYFVKRKIHLNIDDIIEQIIDDPIEEVILENIDRKKVTKAIKMLTPEYQEVIYWIIYQKKTYSETSNIMNKSVGQVRMLFLRAKRKLRSILESEGD